MKPGDKVQWLEVKKTKSGGVNFTMREGKLIETNDDFSIVKKGKNIYTFPTKELQVVGSGPNQLTKLMRGE